MPGNVPGTREVFGLSQPLFAKFLGARVSAVRHWERRIKGHPRSEAGEAVLCRHDLQFFVQIA